MSGYIAFSKKELMENTRNYRLFIMLALFFIFGMLSPVSAKFTPQLIASLTPDMQITIAEPTALDSWKQFYKNISSLGFSLMIIIFSGCLSGEYSKGTLINMLTKGLSRPTVILSKFFIAAGIMTISYWMSFGITYGYTAYGAAAYRLCWNCLMDDRAPVSKHTYSWVRTVPTGFSQHNLFIRSNCYYGDYWYSKTVCKL